MGAINIKSYNNATEFLFNNQIYQELTNAINAINIVDHMNKICLENNDKRGTKLISPRSLNAEIHEKLDALGWAKYKVCLENNNNPELFEKSIQDRSIILPVKTNTNNNKNIEIDFRKDEVGVEVQFGKYSFIAHDILKLKTFYDLGIIKVAVMIVIDDKLHRNMSTGPCNFSSTIFYANLFRKFIDFPFLVVGVG